MLREKFETWPADLFSDATLVTICIHVTNLGYLEDGSPYFLELLKGSMEKSNKMFVGLDTIAVISETNNWDLPDLIDLEVEWANKMKEKAKRRRQKKINLT